MMPESFDIGEIRWNGPDLPPKKMELQPQTLVVYHVDPQPIFMEISLITKCDDCGFTFKYGHHHSPEECIVMQVMES